MPGLRSVSKGDQLGWTARVIGGGGREDSQGRGRRWRAFRCSNELLCGKEEGQQRRDGEGAAGSWQKSGEGIWHCRERACYSERRARTVKYAAGGQYTNSNNLTGTQLRNDEGAAGV